METYKIKNTNEFLRIIPMEDVENPRVEWDNLATMVCFHKRYNLGDKTTLKSDDFNGWEELHDYLVKEEDAEVIKSLILYDHSGISISTSREYPFNCQWDSMQIGFIYITKKTIKENNLTTEHANAIIDGEVETYNQYLTGEVFSFTRYKMVKCEKCGNEEEEDINSCWGFYGYNHEKSGLFESAGVKKAELE
jgi:hypothetical protein